MTRRKFFRTLGTASVVIAIAPATLSTINVPAPVGGSMVMKAFQSAEQVGLRFEETVAALQTMTTSLYSTTEAARRLSAVYGQLQEQAS